ncbi:hypothetical protein EMCRGX_G031796 [Ephydatia muelleri]
MLLRPEGPPYIPTLHQRLRYHRDYQLAGCDSEFSDSLSDRLQIILVSYELDSYHMREGRATKLRCGVGGVTLSQWQFKMATNPASNEDDGGDEEEAASVQHQSCLGGGQASETLAAP